MTKPNRKKKGAKETKARTPSAPAANDGPVPCVADATASADDAAQGVPIQDSLYTVTFYSYKGGVGRTLALLNVAAILARMGNRVAIADFDVEAPGIDAYPGFRPPEPDHPGLMEWLSAYTSSPDLIAPSCKEYVYPVFDKGLHRSHAREDEQTRPRLAGGTPNPNASRDEAINADLASAEDGDRSNTRADPETFGPEPVDNADFKDAQGNGAIYVMRAGRQDVAYRQALATLDWDKLFDKQDGHLLFANLKNELFDEYGCNFLLIDSRTGLTDVAGVCTAFLPDSVILMFYPDEQNERGITTVAKAIRQFAEREERIIRRMYCVSRVPDGPGACQEASNRLCAIFDDAENLEDVARQLGVALKSATSRHVSYDWNLAVYKGVEIGGAAEELSNPREKGRDKESHNKTFFYERYPDGEFGGMPRSLIEDRRDLAMTPTVPYAQSDDIRYASFAPLAAFCCYPNIMERLQLRGPALCEMHRRSSSTTNRARSIEDEDRLWCRPAFEYALRWHPDVLPYEKEADAWDPSPPAPDVMSLFREDST